VSSRFAVDEGAELGAVWDRCMREVARAIGLTGIDPGRLAEVMPLLVHGRWRSHATRRSDARLRLACRKRRSARTQGRRGADRWCVTLLGGVRVARATQSGIAGTRKKDEDYFGSAFDRGGAGRAVLSTVARGSAQAFRGRKKWPGTATADRSNQSCAKRRR